MIQDKVLGIGMEAQEEHGSKREDGTHGKYQVQGKYIAKQTVVFVHIRNSLRRTIKNLR